jgi:zinc/manganese transport system ATP-binding protein
MLQLENVSLQREGRTVLRDLSGRFPPGSLTAVIGPNGAGKSTLLAALAGDLPPASGRIVRAPGLRMAYLPQISTLDRHFPLQVHEVVALGLWPQLGPWRGLSRAQRDQVQAALHEVGLTELARQPLQTLSTGQFQRMLFARLILQEAQFLLLDEPFAAMDEPSTQDLLALLQRWRDQGRTVVTVLHDLAQVREHFSHALLLAGHAVAWGPVTEVLQPAPLQRAGYLLPALHAHPLRGHCA